MVENSAITQNKEKLELINLIVMMYSFLVALSRHLITINERKF